MKLLQTKYGATIIFLTILFVFGLSQERALAANFRVCPIDGGVGDDDFSQNGTITINSAQTFQANVSNKGVIDCGVLNLVINSTITAQSFIATPFDANPDDDFGVLFKTTGDITISATAKIIADNQGYAAGQGPGTSATSASAGGGSYGNYAGCGGSNGRSCPQPPYGSSFNPRSLGSGGGNGQNRQFVAGGSGGGAITLEAKNITLDGEILARGGNGGGILGRYGQNAASGGGAGGSILIKASADLRGNGRLSVRGGNGGEYGDYKGGGGSGGRIALYYSSYDFLISTLQTNFEIGGGTAVSTGENGRIGTFAMFDNSKTPFSSRVFGNFEFRFNDAQDGKFSFSDFTIERNGIVYLQNGDDKVLKLEIAGNLMNDGDFRCGDGIKKGLNLLVGGDFTLGNGARMSCNANGYGSGEGPGAGEQGSSAGGAGHGGKGSVGIGNGIGIGGVSYDDYQLPKEGGSGGGIGQNRSTISGGNGGGSLEIIVGKDAIIDGKLAANGNNGLSEAGNFGQNVASGGGAGGTIYLKALNLYGTGRIEANGGNGGVITGYIGGGGSGGRVAIYYLNHSGTILDGCGDGLSENCLNILAKLGREGTNGENGTIFINKEPPPTPEEIFIDEGPAQPIEDQQDGNNGESPDENNARIQTLSCVKLYGKTASWPLSMGSGELNFDALTGSVESLSTCIHLNEGSKETIQPVGQDSYTGLGNVMEGWVWNTNVGWLSFNCKDIEQILGNDSFCELGSRYQVYRDKDGFLRGYGWGTKVGWVWFNFQDGCADCAQNGDADFRPRLDEIITDPNDLNVGKGLLHGYGWNPRVGYINLEGAFVRPSCVTEDCIVPPEIVTDMPRSFLCSTDTDMSYIYRPKLVPNTGTPEVLYDGGKILGEPEVTFDPLAPEMKMTITKEFCASIPQDGKKNVDLEIRAWNNHTTGGGWGSLGGEDLKRWTVSIINSCAQTSTITCVPVAPTTDINSAWLGKHYEVDCTANAAQEGGAAPTQPLTWSLEGGIPAGMIHVGIDGDTGLKRKIIYDPPDSGIPEDYYIRVRGQNACSNATFGYILKLDAQIPEITSSCPTSILHDLVEYRYQPLTLGAKPINFSITPNQKIKNYNEREMLIDSQTGRVYNWLSPNIFPNKEDRGYSFELSARNNYGSDTETCNFTVVSEAIPPIVDISTKLNGAIRYYTLGKNLPFSYEYRLLKGTQPIDWSFEGDLQGIATIQDGRFTWNLNPEEEESHEANRYEVINLKASNAASKPEENFYWARETEDPANPYIPEEPDRFTIVPGYAPVINISEIPEKDSALYHAPDEFIYTFKCQISNQENPSAYDIGGTLDPTKNVTNTCQHFNLKILNSPEGELTINSDTGQLSWGGNGPDELRPYTFVLQTSNAFGTVTKELTIYVRNIPEIKVPELSECHEGDSLTIPVQVVAEPEIFEIGFENRENVPNGMSVGYYRNLGYQVRFSKCAHPTTGPNNPDGVTSSYNLKLYAINGYGGEAPETGYSNDFEVSVLPPISQPLKIKSENVHVEEKKQKDYVISLESDKQGNGAVTFKLLSFKNSLGQDVNMQDYIFYPNYGQKNGKLSWVHVPEYNLDDSKNKYYVLLRAIDSTGQISDGAIIFKIIKQGGAGQKEIWTEKVYSSIKGSISLRKEVLSQNNTEQKMINVGDISSTLSRDVIYANVISLTKGAKKGSAIRNMNNSIGGIISNDLNNEKLILAYKNIPALGSAGVALDNDNILYFEDKAVRLYKNTAIKNCELDWQGHQTIIVNGGNLYIDCGLRSTRGGTLDIVTLSDPQFPKIYGNIYIDYRITDLAGAHIYADGSLFRYSANQVSDPVSENPAPSSRQSPTGIPSFYEDVNNGQGCYSANVDNNGIAGIQFDEFAQCMDDYLPNQLYLKGSINSRNTIGGVKFDLNGIFKESFVDGYGKITTQLFEAASYDLNLFSFYHLNFDSTGCEPGKAKKQSGNWNCETVNNSFAIQDQVFKRTQGRHALSLNDPYGDNNTLDYTLDPIFEPEYPREPVVFEYMPFKEESKVFRLR